MIKILALPGSLRLNASSNQILQTIKALAPPQVDFEIFDRIGNIPHFNDADVIPHEVVSFRQKLKSANAVLICTPEYAFGVPGALKNAIDWTVSSGEFSNKPVGLVTASSHGTHGHAAMQLILNAISANLIVDATILIPFVRSKMDANGNINDPELTEDLKRVWEGLILSTRGNVVL